MGNGGERAPVTMDDTYDGAGQIVMATGKESGWTVRMNEKFGCACDAAWNLQRRPDNGSDRFRFHPLAQGRGMSLPHAD